MREKERAWGYWEGPMGMEKERERERGERKGDKRGSEKERGEG